jgi:Zn-dependent protease
MRTETLVLGGIWYLVFVFSTVLHEAAHAFAALKLGDRTAYLGGQVSLDPIPHIRREPFGMVVVPILVFVLSGGNWMMGWASAPLDPFWVYDYPKRAALVSLAGPVANLFLVLVSGVLLRVGMETGLLGGPGGGGWLAEAGGDGAPGVVGAFRVVLSIAFLLNVVLFTFNLLPLPPLDGSNALPLVLRPSLARRYLDFLRNPTIALIGLVAAWKLFDVVFPHVFRVARDVLLMGR